MKVMKYRIAILGLCLICSGKMVASEAPQQPSRTAYMPAPQPAAKGEQPTAANAAPSEQAEIHPQEANPDIERLRAAAAQYNQPPIIVQVQAVPAAPQAAPQLQAYNQGIEGFVNRNSGVLAWCSGGAAVGYFSQMYRTFNIPRWLRSVQVPGLQVLIEHPITGTATTMFAGTLAGYAGHHAFNYFFPGQQPQGLRPRR